jgi:cysteine-rich repeat protein
VNEACDDGNLIDDDGCSNDCNISVCGDGVKQINEQCDTGIFEEQCGGKGVECQDCQCVTPLFCGDGKKNQDSEQCDDGNTNNTDGCTTLCISCEVPLLPDAPAGCIYKTQLNKDDCPSAKLICSNNVCENGLQKSQYPNCVCGEGSYLAIATESCVVDPITSL